MAAADSGRLGGHELPARRGFCSRRFNADRGLGGAPTQPLRQAILGIMTVSAAQAGAFYREVVKGGVVYAVRDAAGFPAPLTSSGQRAMPFWSKRSRAQKVVDTVAAYGSLEVVAIPVDEWRSEWLPDLEQDGLQVGVNWSGANATGYDLSVADLLRNIDARASLDKQSAPPPTACR